jgi:hypothetical protein
MTRSNFGTRKAAAWSSAFRDLRRLQQRGAGLRVPVPRFTSFAVIDRSRMGSQDRSPAPWPPATTGREALCRVYRAPWYGFGPRPRCIVPADPGRRSARQHQLARWTFKGPRALRSTSSGRQTRSFGYEGYPPRASKKVRRAVGRQIPTEATEHTRKASACRARSAAGAGQQGRKKNRPV